MRRRGFFRALAGLFAVAASPAVEAAPTLDKGTLTWLTGWNAAKRVPVEPIWWSQFRHAEHVRIWHDGKLIMTFRSDDQALQWDEARFEVAK